MREGGRECDGRHEALIGNDSVDLTARIIRMLLRMESDAVGDRARDVVLAHDAGIAVIGL